MLSATTMPPGMSSACKFWVSFGRRGQACPRPGRGRPGGEAGTARGECARGGSRLAAGRGAGQPGPAELLCVHQCRSQGMWAGRADGGAASGGRAGPGRLAVRRPAEGPPGNGQCPIGYPGFARSLARASAISREVVSAGRGFSRGADRKLRYQYCYHGSCNFHCQLRYGRGGSSYLRVT